MSPNDVKVSVITVCRNSERTIEQCVNSVKAQSHSNIEHIVIDGASNDKTITLIKNINTPNLILISEKDGGIYDAMNKGMEYASGDIIGFLNSDDWYASKDVIKNVAFLFHQKKVSAVFSNVCFVSRNNKNRITRFYRGDNFNLNMLKYGMMPPHPGIFINRNFALKVGKFNTDYKISADFDFVCRMVKATGFTVAHLNKTTVNMTPGGASNSGIKSKVILNLEILRSCKEHKIPTSFLYLLVKYLKKSFQIRF